MMKGRRIARTAAYVQGRRRSRNIPVYNDSRAHEEADEFERKARLLAPRVGFCGYCGAIVDEPNGKLHGHDCSVEEERRAPKA